MSIWGGIEVGGTKLVCAVGTGPDELRAEARFPTTTSAQNLSQAIAFFRHQQKVEPLTAIGIGCFGPLDLQPASPTFGYVTTSTKPGWAYTDLVGTIRQALGVPVGLETDVNVAALGEHRWGAAQDVDTFVYLTVGTGVGGGGMVNGQLMHGLIHPEMGHIRVPHDRQADPYEGCCPYHADCWQGLAAGPALAERWGQPTETLPVDHPAWQLEAHYLALGLVNLICILSPQRVIIGGGVMAQTPLFPLIRQDVKRLLNGYLNVPLIVAENETYIVPPRLGDRAGVLGAIALAQQTVS